eukprot:TRINITY_DN5718_c0_g1_i5.p1 TRINITY_DN5718_c0_g1~~TRINITY_DN5718_c0_g1_i5.p1  ORF type:complete len:355 (+),score=84.24 TRINITY_DN5718_c0_g1_i5:124-1188(+)
MGKRACDESDDASYSGSESESDPKRGRYDRQAASILDDGATAESQLENMLAGAAAAASVAPMAGGPMGMPPGGLGGLGGTLQASKPGQPGGMPGLVPGMSITGLGVPGIPGMDGPRVETTAMDFSKLTTNQLAQSTVIVQKKLVDSLMTSEHRRLLTEETGCNVEWKPDEASVALSGSAEQVKKAQRLLARVMMHCRWGYGEAKVRRLLRPRRCSSVLCRLSPMNTLRPIEKNLSVKDPMLTIGKDKNCDATIADQLISRQHVAIELDEERGAVYVLDCSTNGTFLNGIRLPGKQVGKVLLSHGDELLLKDPSHGEQEFGYIVNLQEVLVREALSFSAPRRLLTAEELKTSGRD